MSLTTTPSANRLHIGIFGKRNSGKSSLINAITNQDTALTSEVAGTTTDPVYKAMEIHGIGPCMLIDTAGFDDEGELGALRVRAHARRARKDRRGDRRLLRGGRLSGGRLDRGAAGTRHAGRRRHQQGRSARQRLRDRQGDP